MTQPWADVVAIEQVLYRYAHVLDRGTLEDVMPMFHPDAEDVFARSDDGWVIQQRTLIVTDRHRFAGE